MGKKSGKSVKPACRQVRKMERGGREKYIFDGCSLNSREQG